MPKGLLDRFIRDFTFRFMIFRRFTFVFSAVAAVTAMALFATINMNYGIDFKGGSMIEVQAKDGNADVGDIRAQLSELNLGDIQAQEFGSAGCVDPGSGPGRRRKCGADRDHTGPRRA
jgi:SecD/SecF fusion protein